MRAWLKKISLNTISVIAGLVVLHFSILTMAADDHTDKKQYIMGVFPYLPPRQLEEIFSPMALDLGNAVNRDIILRTNTTFKRFVKNLDSQIFGIAFVQPFDYVRIADKFGYSPLATRTEKLTAILVVKENSTLKNIHTLKGKRIALPPKKAAVSYLIRDYLYKSGLDPDKDVVLSHHRSHVSCMQQVLIGATDACGTAAPPLRFFQHKMKVKMKIIAESMEIPHSLFVIHPRIPQNEKEIIKQQIISWSETTEGKKLLDHGQLKPFVTTSDAHYNIIRKIIQYKSYDKH